MEFGWSGPAWRVGSVPYLNARPLFETLDGVELEVPSILSARFAAGEFDAALIPIFAVLERGGGPVVDDVAIACDGAVHSVFLAYRGELKDVRSVAMDPASRTSVNLLRCLLRGFRGIDFSESSAVEDADQARLLIGDPAMAFR
ncbi:MAG: MqnA/MqnD/SBP family protein, partial [Chthoniobacterales bacterium]